MLSFTHPQLLLALAAYQDSIWPAQPVAYALGALAAVSIVRPQFIFRRLALAILALLWAWTAVAYHWLLFTELSPAALLFGVLFAVQAGLLLVPSVSSDPPPSFQFRPEPASFAGAALIVFALLIYPVLDLILLAWPRMPWLGISPCPVTLFTLGFLLLSTPRMPARYWIVPIGWALLEGVSAFLLGIIQDMALLPSGLAALLLIVGGVNRVRRAT